MSLHLITAPSALPIDLATAKLHCRIDGDDEDVIVNGLINAAVSHLDARDGVLGRCLITQTWELRLCEFPDQIYLPLPPLGSVSSVKYVDLDGVVQTLDTSTYDVFEQGNGPAIVQPKYLQWWPASVRYEPDAVRVQYTAGYGSTGASVPQPIKQAMYLLVEHLYRNRGLSTAEALMEIPFSVSALVSPYRVGLF